MIEGVDYRQRHWEDVAAGEELPRSEDHLTYRRVIMNPAATGDFFPGHHDPEYARSQGHPTIYVNTAHVLGFVDRVVTGWGGPASFVARRAVSLQRPLYAGDTMVGEGRVTRVYRQQRQGLARHLVDLEVVVTNQDGAVCCPASVTVELPSREPSSGSDLAG